MKDFIKNIHTTPFLFLLQLSLVITILSSDLFARGSQEAPALRPTRLLLDWVPNTNHIGAYVALKNGYFEEEGLALEIPPIHEASVLSLVGSGKAEFGFSYQEGLTYARASDTPIPVVAIAAVIAHNTSGFASPRFTNIQGPKDFEGKVYGAFGSETEYAILDTILAPYSLSSNDVTFVQADSLDFFQATKSGLYDFAWIFRGWTGIEADIRGIDLYYEDLKDLDPHLDYYTPILLTSERLIQEEAHTVQSFIRAISRGYNFAIQNPQKAAEILIEYLPETDPELIGKSMDYLAPRFADKNSTWGYMKDEIWNGFTDWLKSQDFIPKDFSISDAYNNSFIEALE